MNGTVIWLKWVIFFNVSETITCNFDVPMGPNQYCLFSQSTDDQLDWRPKEVNFCFFILSILCFIRNSFFKGLDVCKDQYYVKKISVWLPEMAQEYEP